VEQNIAGRGNPGITGGLPTRLPRAEQRTITGARRRHGRFPKQLSCPALTA